MTRPVREAVWVHKPDHWGRTKNLPPQNGARCCDIIVEGNAGARLNPMNVNSVWDHILQACESKDDRPR